MAFRMAGAARRSAFVGAAKAQSQRVQAIDLGSVLGFERHHNAIADGRRAAVKRFGDAKSRAAAGESPKR